ncbi:MAG: tRNA (adenosine(37)-N6)-threonylcarbamoyltransferase complex ATPase subunit type 1 TsaE [Ardenticatenia bacterium]|nr:tRNA (adenosine(37)-N6)-threonylcarbamoyltransferase complex ATPase subunit type 1 TsaE [Ardenticatenia bacterium]
MIPDPAFHFSPHSRAGIPTPEIVTRCFLSATPLATQALAAALAPLLPPGCLLRLEGELGAGKTTFVQGLARGLGVAGPVQSPTFTLIREHAGGGAMGLAHMDFYRLSGAVEAQDLGLDAYLDGDDLLAVEWPDRAGDALPRRGLSIALAPAAVDGAAVAVAGRMVAGSRGPDDDPLDEPPRLIRLWAYDGATAAALDTLARPDDPGLREICCPPAGADHD